MRFSRWIAERNQRDDVKMPERRSALDLHRRAASKNIHGMVHGRAGSHDTERHKGSRGRNNREEIDRSSRGE